MTLHWKLVIDAHDPHAQAAFWAEALGYVVARLETLGAAVQRRVRAAGGAWTLMTDPEGNEFCVQ
ncbi:VOC family protein [Streptomyces sp. AN091965]|uniref:VOC family protein n=1 Tax=Streptomyces sp. AN091965 TaxID=2927803 RepID=UPI001F62410E|nr:VOC family protein [Streptomyces sp. AN091965]MCI3932399.1 hypothetical protein [Streptomyces sp. AN091965]